MCLYTRVNRHVCDMHVRGYVHLSVVPVCSKMCERGGGLQRAQAQGPDPSAPSGIPAACMIACGGQPSSSLPSGAAGRAPGVDMGSEDT